jgi:hypothetical protein
MATSQRLFASFADFGRNYDILSNENLSSLDNYILVYRLNRQRCAESEFVSEAPLIAMHTQTWLLLQTLERN